ncbi:large subunit ribosomal protein L22 [Candidatus Nanopelagicus hibericus]|uniref:Large ribosomal subunit protein uL22 n=1 Tax=Candidatus Nanopelagicus hibericus TaxID=1884915 RepID=A0A249K819_9ACTN|nr:50S ribosomal protein L22 [Candidatus Nanopelagicus hibericus]ASY12885.1 large subunit ribosomal protein L22 [Candidatus Nanopelagicus hibericus]
MSNTDTTTALVSRAVLRDLRATPQKARRVVNLVRGQRADTALNMMKFANQPELGQAIYTLIASAVSNAKQKNPSLRDASELWVVEALVDEGFTMKRYRPRAQGRGFAIDKRSSQVTVVLSDDKNLRTNKNLKASQMQKPKARRKPAVIADKPAPTKAADSLSEKPAPKKAAAKKATAKKAPAKKAATKRKAE